MRPAAQWNGRRQSETLKIMRRLDVFDDDYDSDEEGEEERELSGDDRQFESLASQLSQLREGEKGIRE